MLGMSFTRDVGDDVNFSPFLKCGECVLPVLVVIAVIGLLLAGNVLVVLLAAPGLVAGGLTHLYYVRRRRSIKRERKREVFRSV